YIDQNESGTLGWMVSYAHLDAPSHVDETKNWFYTDAPNYTHALYPSDPNSPQVPDQPELAGTQVLSGYEFRATNSEDIRDGITGTLEWKPSDVVHSVLDLYYSRFKQDSVTR